MYFLCIFIIIQLKVLSYSPRTSSYLLINAEISHFYLLSGQTQSPNTLDIYHRWTKNPRPPSTGQTSSKLHRHFFFHLELYLTSTAISEVAQVVKTIASALQLLDGKAIFIYFHILYSPMLEMWITNLPLIPYVILSVQFTCYVRQKFKGFHHATPQYSKVVLLGKKTCSAYTTTEETYHQKSGHILPDFAF